MTSWYDQIVMTNGYDPFEEPEIEYEKEMETEND